MKTVLADLHSVINEFEDQGLKREAQALGNVFTRVAQYITEHDDADQDYDSWMRQNHPDPQAYDHDEQFDHDDEMPDGDMSGTDAPDFSHMMPDQEEEEDPAQTGVDPLYAQDPSNRDKALQDKWYGSILDHMNNGASGPQLMEQSDMFGKPKIEDFRSHSADSPDSDPYLG